MSSILFAAQPSTGHLNPILAIARQMRSEGHTISFVCPAPESRNRIVIDNGFRLIPVRPSLRGLGFFLLPLTSGYVETALALELFFSGLSYYARAIGRVLDELRPDVVVSDFAFPGASIAAESRGVPFVVIYLAGLTFAGPGIPPFGSGLPIGGSLGRKGRAYQFMSRLLERSMEGAVARARKRLKLSARETEHPVFLLSPWLNLVLTAEAAEAPRFPLPPSTFFIGPCIAERQGDVAGGFPFERLSSDKPKIYVSLGTVFNKKPRVFGKILAAFADGRHQLIVSAGDAFRKLRRRHLPSDVLLFAHVPQIEVVARVDAVISHGGNNTVNETLAAGKPLLVMPVGGEQGDNASRVVYLGAGLRADLETSTSAEIREKLDRLLEEPAFRRRASEIAGALARTRGPVTAARFIERVALTRQPILRPHGCPLTVTRDAVPPWELGVDRKVSG